MRPKVYTNVHLNPTKNNFLFFTIVCIHFLFALITHESFGTSQRLRAASPIHACARLQPAPSRCVSAARSLRETTILRTSEIVPTGRTFYEKMPSGRPGCGTCFSGVRAPKACRNESTDADADVWMADERRTIDTLN